MRTRRGSCVRGVGVAVLVGWSGLLPLGAFAAPLVESVAYARSDEVGGADPGTDTESAQTADPNADAHAHAVRCLGAGECVVDPETIESSGAHAAARADFGTNRADAVGHSGPDESDDYVVDSAWASSLWVDEWSFAALPQYAGDPVTIELHLDGSWQNTGFARFEAAVADSTMEPVQNDDEIPFLNLDGKTVSFVGFDSTADFAFNGVAPFVIPIEDGNEPDGQVDLTLTLSFVPVPLRTYLVGGRLRVEADGEEDDERSDFGSTATVTEVRLPAGLSLTSASGASWNVVPEPAQAVLLAVGVFVGAAVRRRAR